MTASAELIVAAQAQAQEDPHAGVGHGDTGMSTALLGVLLFIGSELMFFAGLFAAYFNARAAAAQWPPEGVTFINAQWLPVIVTVKVACVVAPNSSVTV